jgi:HEXXH motif-containing protein
MIIGLPSASVIHELSEELGQKTLSLASERLRQNFPRLVPWMCMVCLTDAHVVDTSIFFDQYPKGELLVRPENLYRIANFLESDGRVIMDSTLAANMGLDPTQFFSVIQEIGDEEAAWVECYSSARALLMKSDEFFPAIFDDLVQFIVPIKADGKFDFSTHLARGAIFFSAPEPPHPEITMAIDLAHEMGHQAMMLFQSADRLIASPLEQPTWSAIRKTLRPAIQCMQAVSAMAFMIVFMRGTLRTERFDAAQNSYLQEYYNSMVSGMIATLAGLKESCQFTPIGNQLFREFCQLVEQQ